MGAAGGGETEFWDECAQLGLGCDYNPICATLSTAKPQNCLNPIPKPSGYDCGRDSFPGGSAMAKLLYIIDHGDGADAASRQIIRDAMAWQTEQFANLTPSFDQVIDVFVGQIQTACDLQIAAPPAATTDHDRRCMTALDKILAETNEQQTFLQWILNWAGINGLDPADLGIPQTLINLGVPNNSVSIKFDRVAGDAICANWWQAVQQNQC